MKRYTLIFPVKKIATNSHLKSLQNTSLGAQNVGGNQIAQTIKSEVEDWVLHNIYGLKVDDDGFLEYEDYYEKHYDDDKFAWFLKDYATEGKLIYTGEDGERWGYYFDGKGKLFVLEFIEKVGMEITTPEG